MDYSRKKEIVLLYLDQHMGWNEILRTFNIPGDGMLQRWIEQYRMIIISVGVKMDKGITFYFGFNISPKLRAKMIRQAGFNYVITNADKRFNRQNGSIAKQIKLFNKNGLKVSSLHMTYKSEELPYFWEEGKFGEKLKKKLIKDVKIAHKYGFRCVVVHVDGQFSQIGCNRLKDILCFCDKYCIPLALENLDKNHELLQKIFANVPSKWLRFCYDSGHNNVFDRQTNYLHEFSDKLVTLHLHDNDGRADLHTISKIVSSIDWNKIAKGLKNHKDLILDYELLNRKENKLNAEEYLREAYKQASDLEKKILGSNKRA